MLRRIFLYMKNAYYIPGKESANRSLEMYNNEASGNEKNIFALQIVGKTLTSPIMKTIVEKKQT